MILKEKVTVSRNINPNVLECVCLSPFVLLSLSLYIVNVESENNASTTFLLTTERNRYHIICIHFQNLLHFLNFLKFYVFSMFNYPVVNVKGGNKNKS